MDYEEEIGEDSHIFKTEVETKKVELYTKVMKIKRLSSTPKNWRLLRCKITNGKNNEKKN